MNSIFIKQNSEKLLKLQFSQRKHYNMAEKYNDISWALAVLIVAINIINQFSNILGSYAVLIDVIFSIVVLGIDYLSNYNVKIGSATKAYIDNELFQFTESEFKSITIEKLNEIATEVITKYPEEYKIQKNSTGKYKPTGIKDWYSFKSEESNEKIILECQKENVWWDGELSKRYFIFILTSGITLLALILLIGWLLNPQTRTIIISVLSGFSFIIKISEDIIHALYYYKNYNNAVSKIQMIESNYNINLNELMLLQKDINEIRGIKFLVPDLIHKIYSQKLHILKENMQ